MPMFAELFAKIRFANPDASDVVILSSHDYWIRKLVLKEMPCTTLALHPEGLCITPALIARTLLRLRLIKWQQIGKRGSLKDLARQTYLQYLLACLDQAKAKVVLTFIDNSVIFQKLSRMDHKRTYIAIQNGARTLACVRDSLPKPPHPLSTISMTNLFCFGQRDVELFARHGHKVDNPLPAGSLIGGYYKSVVSTATTEPKFDLCLISQWHNHFFEEMAGDGFPACAARRTSAGMHGLNSFLLRLLKETGLSLVICPRNDDIAEREYYKSLFGDRVQLVEADRENFSTYRAIEQSRLAIALNSTTLSEVFAWGQKTLWCNVPNDEHYEMPEAGISYFAGDDYSAFKERVLMLLKMPRDEYEKLTREKARYINQYDPANPPHEIIRMAVIKALSGSDQSTSC